MSDEKKTRPSEKIHEVAAEIADVLEKHDIGGVFLLSSKEGLSVWEATFPKWCLIDDQSVTGGYELKRKLRKTDHEMAEQTMLLIEELASMADECLIEFSELAGRLESVFVKAGLIPEPEPEPEPELVPSTERPNLFMIRQLDSGHDDMSDPNDPDADKRN